MDSKGTHCASDVDHLRRVRLGDCANNAQLRTRGDDQESSVSHVVEFTSALLLIVMG